MTERTPAYEKGYNAFPQLKYHKRDDGSHALIRLFEPVPNPYAEYTCEHEDWSDGYENAISDETRGLEA